MQIVKNNIFEGTSVAIRHGGTLLIHFRKRSGISIRQASRLSGISTAELSRLEHNKRVLKLAHVTRLQAAYQLNADDIDALISCDDLAASGSKPNPLFPQQNQVFKLYRAIEMKKRGFEARHISFQLPVSIEVSASAYLVHFTEDNGLGMLPGRSILVADPAARPILSDVIINCLTFDPLVVKLCRSETGELIGIHPDGSPVIFQDDTTVKSFHKVVTVFSVTHLGLDLPAHY